MDAGAMDEATQGALAYTEEKRDDSFATKSIVAIMERKRKGSSAPIQKLLIQHQEQRLLKAKQEILALVRENLPKIRTETDPYKRTAAALSLFSYPFSTEGIRLLDTKEQDTIIEESIQALPAITKFEQRLAVLLVLGEICTILKKQDQLRIVTTQLESDISQQSESISDFFYGRPILAAVDRWQTVADETAVRRIKEKIRIAVEENKRKRLAEAIASQDVKKLMQGDSDPMPTRIEYLDAAKNILLKEPPIATTQDAEYSKTLSYLASRYTDQQAFDDAIEVTAAIPDEKLRYELLGQIHKQGFVLNEEQRANVRRVLPRVALTEDRDLMHRAALLSWSGEEQAAQYLLRQIKQQILAPKKKRTDYGMDDEGWHDLLTVAKLQKESNDLEGAVDTLERFCKPFNGDDQKYFESGWGAEGKLDDLEQASRLLISMGQSTKAWKIVRCPMQSFIRRPSLRIVRVNKGNTLYELPYEARKLAKDEVISDYSAVTLRYGAGVQARNGDIAGAAYTARHIAAPEHYAAALAEVVYEYIGRNGKNRRDLPFVGTGGLLK